MATRTQQGFSFLEVLLIIAIVGIGMLAASNLTTAIAKSLRSEDLEIIVNQEVRRLDILLADPSACTLNLKDVDFEKDESSINTTFKIVQKVEEVPDPGGAPESHSIANEIMQNSILFGTSKENGLKIKEAYLSPSDEAADLKILTVTFQEETQSRPREFIRKLPIHIKIGSDGLLEACSSMPMISSSGPGVCPPTTASRCAAGGPKLSVTKLFTFPSIKGCAWGINGNLNKTTRFRAQARTETYQSLGLPPGAELCSVNFTFNPDKIVYDDEFYFTLNNVIIAASEGPSVSQFLPSSHGMYLWSWPNLRGQRAILPGGSATRYCAPAPEAEAKISVLNSEYTTAIKTRKKAILAEIAKIRSAEGNLCQWPRTQSTGTINMRFSPETFIKVFQANPMGDQGFGMITTGNAHATDCAQSGISFTAEIEYLK